MKLILLTQGEFFFFNFDTMCNENIYSDRPQLQWIRTIFLLMLRYIYFS